MSVSTKNIERINEDFYLNFDGVNDQLKVTTKLPFIVSTADWSLSCFAYIRDSSGVQAYIFDNRNDVIADSNGFSLYGVNITSTTYTLRITTGRSGATTYNFSTLLRTNGFQHIVLSFDNVANDLNLYVNGYLAETINIGTNTITVAGGAFTTIGSLINSSNFTEGGLSKLAFFDSQLTAQEVQYIYETAEIPESAFSNLQNYYPLNQVAAKSNGSNWFSDVANVYLGKNRGISAPVVSTLQRSAIIFSEVYNSSDSFEFKQIDIGNSGSQYMVGFTDDTNLLGYNSNPISANEEQKAILYGVYITGANLYLIQNGVQGTLIGASPNKKPIKFVRSGTNIELYYDGVLEHTWTSTPTTDFRIKTVIRDTQGNNQVYWGFPKKNDVDNNSFTNNLYDISDSFDLKVDISRAAEAIGWTDNEVGTNNQHKATSIYGYKSKSRLSGRLGLRGGRVDSEPSSSTRSGWKVNYQTSGGTIPDFSTGYTIVLKGNFSTQGQVDAGQPFTVGFVHDDSGSDANVILFEVNNPNNIRYRINSSYTTITEPRFNLSNTSTIVVTVNVLTGSVSIYVDGIISHNYTISTPVNTLGTAAGKENGICFNVFPETSPHYGFKRLDYNILFDRELTSIEIREGFEKENYLDLSPVAAYTAEQTNTSNGDVGVLDLEDISGNGLHAIYVKQTAVEHLDSNSGFIESSSNLEPRKKALSFNGTNQYLETLTFAEASNGYTIILGVANINIASGQKDFFVMDDTTPDNRIAIGWDNSTGDFTFKSGNGGTVTTEKVTGTKETVNLLSYRIAPNTSPYNYGSYDRVSDVSGQNRDVNASYGYATRAGGQSIFLGKDSATTYTQLTVFRCIVIDGIITDERLKYLINSGFTNNFTDADNVLLDLDFNNPINDSGLKIPDLTGTYTTNANGYTDLTDLESNLVEINSLF